MTEDEYHEHDAISASKLKMFAESHKRYRQTYVDKTMPATTSPEMTLGKLIHCMVLEPHAVDSRFAVEPKLDRRTKQGKEAHAELEASAAADNKTLVDAKTWSTATEVQRAVLSHVAAWKLLTAEGAEVEKMMFWSREGLPLKCRAKMDLVLDTDVIVDLKTTSASSQASFARDVVNYYYDRQAAWYCEGYSILRGAWPNFIFIAAQTRPPYEVGVYELSQIDIDAAAKDNFRDACRLCECMATNEWRQPHERDVVKLTLPTYAKYRNSYAYGDAE